MHPFVIVFPGLVLRDFVEADLRACADIVGAEIEYDAADMLLCTKRVPGRATDAMVGNYSKDKRFKHGAETEQTKRQRQKKKKKRNKPNNAETIAAEEAASLSSSAPSSESGKIDSIFDEREADLELSCYLPCRIGSEEQARRLAGRSILIVRIIELWGQGPDLESCVRESLAHASKFWPQLSTSAGQTFVEGTTFAFRDSAFNAHIPGNQHVQLYRKFSELPMWKVGKVKLDQPEHEFRILQDFGKKYVRVGHGKQELRVVYFGRTIAVSNRTDWLSRYRLNRRAYIGTTTMDPELALLVANTARVGRNSCVLDPFVGTGSLLIAAASVGAYVMGADIDGTVLSGRTKKYAGTVSPIDSFYQYSLQSRFLGFIQADASKPAYWRDESEAEEGEDRALDSSKRETLETRRSVHFFDAIIADPPYGVRAGARRTIGGAAATAAVAEENNKNDHVEEKEKEQAKQGEEKYEEQQGGIYTSVYPTAQQNRDLLSLAARKLVLGGHLVFWMPATLQRFSSLSLPTHPSMELRENCEQVLSFKHSRRMLVYQKVRKFIIAEEAPNATSSTTSASFGDDLYRSDQLRERKKSKQDSEERKLKRAKPLNMPLS